MNSSLCVAFVLVLAATTAYADKKKLFKMEKLKECFESNHVDVESDDFKKLMMDEYPEKENLKCLVKCMFEVSDLLGKDGKVDLEGLKKVLMEAEEGKKAEVESVVKKLDECVDKIKIDDCDKAYEFDKCMTKAFSM